MPNLYTIETRKEASFDTLLPGEKYSVLYHNLFDFPMNFADLVKWAVKPSLIKRSLDPEIVSKNGYYFISGNEAAVYKRVLRKRISNKKMAIAREAATILSLIPGVKMVAVTGSLAMQNSADDSDIDLLIITKRGTLWTTRLISYFVTGLFGIKTRKPNDNRQKDKLCLNMWLDESDLVWNDRNIYTSHEIAQIIPLVNKYKTYEKFLRANAWLLDFWPNSVRIVKQGTRIKSSKEKSPLFTLIERVAYRIQYGHMKSKITRETVTPTRALFHPQDWGSVVLDRIKGFS